MRRKNSKVAIVPLKGINTSTPDNAVEDGACEVLHNMRIKDGAWRNVGSLEWVGSLNGIGEVIYKHPSASEGSYIIVVSDGDKKVGVKSYDLTNREFTCEFHNGEFDEVSVMHLGRLLILNIDGKMSYWRNTEDTGNYSSAQFPTPATVLIPEKIVTSRTRPYIHTKGVKGNILAGENKSYITPFPFYGYTATNDWWQVYYPIFSEQGALMQPTIRDDWWWGEICFFVAYKTKDGHYVSPSSLNIIASELDNAGESTDLIVDYVEGLRYSYGVYSKQVTETGIVNGKMQMQIGNITGQGQADYIWCDRNSSELIGDYDTETNGPQKSLGIYEASGPKIPYSARIQANALMIAPVCRLSFSDVDTELIESIAVFSTRIHSRWSTQYLSEIWDTFEDDGESISGETFDYKRLFADNKLPEQPFYKVLDIPYSEWVADGNGGYEFDIALTGSLLENAEQKEVWEPINPHEIVYKRGKEINSMMHVFGDVHQNLFEGYGALGFMRSAPICDPSWALAVSLKIDGVYYCVCNECGFDLRDSLLRKNIVSYPDARAVQIWNGSSRSQCNAYDLMPALPNNYAYYMADIFESDNNVAALKYYSDALGDTKRMYYCKFPHRWKDTNTYFNGEIIPIIIGILDGVDYKGNSVMSLFELRVSALSNPMVFPLSHTYRVGSEDNQIIAINSAAIELSDDKIGEYPTWVFTTEGVFVGHWGEGDEVIYRSFLPRTYDKICNPNTLAVNGSILFITEQGLMSINERGSQLLSTPLNNIWGIAPQWLVEANVLGWKYDTNEVFVAGAGSDIHVFNLGAGLWSTRANPLPPIGKLLSNEYLIGGDTQTIYSIQHERDFSFGGGFTRILTRPIKMGEYEMKRIETLIVRLAVSAKLPIKVTIYGSVDGAKWGVLRQANVATDSSIRLTHVPMSVRYIKIGIEFPNSTEMAFTSFDIEYYNRFINRLR